MINLFPKNNIGSTLGEAIGGGFNQGLQNQNQFQQQQQLQQQQQQSQLQQMLMQQQMKNQTFQQQNLQKQVQNSQLLDAIEKQRGLAPGSLKGFESNPELALSATKPAALNKFSPLPPEIQETVTKFLNDPNTKSLSDEQFHSEGTRLGIPPAEMERITNIRQNRKAEESKINASDQKQKYQFHKDSAPIWKQIKEGGEASKKRLHSFDTMEKNLASGNLNPKKFIRTFYQIFLEDLCLKDCYLILIQKNLKQLLSIFMKE